MIWFKHCPKCQGDLYNDRDYSSSSIKCIQCGFRRDVYDGSAYTEREGSGQSWKDGTKDRIDDSEPDTRLEVTTHSQKSLV